MRLIELSGPPDAAESQAAWARRLRRWKRAARALWFALQPASRRRRPMTALEFHAEACAPEGAQVGKLYVDGRLYAELDGVNRF